jgi:hypothetical protein
MHQIKISFFRVAQGSTVALEGKPPPKEEDPNARALAFQKLRKQRPMWRPHIRLFQIPEADVTFFCSLYSLPIFRLRCNSQMGITTYFGGITTFFGGATSHAHNFAGGG